MTIPFDEFYDIYRKKLVEAEKIDLATDDATTAIKNLKTLSECLPPSPTPIEVEPEPPTTVMGKLQYGVAKVWDNETTRVLIKAGGAFAGVALVTWTTVHRDVVLLREPLAQANQRTV